MLMSEFMTEEIKVVAFQLHLDKELELDGFLVCFFQKCWSQWEVKWL